MPEPIDTAKITPGPGAPETTDNQFKIWLDDMRPHLELGCSLYRAMEKAAIENHHSAIYKKYAKRDWFADRIDRLRSRPGENTNEALARAVEAIVKRSRRDGDEVSLTHEELEVLKFFASKHRTAQPFFVDRQEQAEAKPEDFGRIVDIPVIEYVTPEGDPDPEATPSQPPAADNTNQPETTNETNNGGGTPAENTVGAQPETTPSVAPTG